MTTPIVGFIPPPIWPTPSLWEFPKVVDCEVRPQQQTPVLPGFDYALSSVAAAEPAVTDAAVMLAEAGAVVIGMEGTPFAWAGLSSHAKARDRVRRVSAAANAPVLFAGMAIIDALNALGAESAALLPTYYAPDWRKAWTEFVGESVPVASSQTMIEQGLVETMTDELAWDIPAHLLRKAVETAGDGDVIVITGAGARTTPLIAELEAIANRPVIGADTALFWALAQEARLPLKPNALGQLTNV